MTGMYVVHERMLKHPGHPDQRVHGRRGSDPLQAIEATIAAIPSAPTGAKREALHAYTGGNGHLSINGYLRRGEVAQGREDIVASQVAALDALFDEPTTSPIQVYRGTKQALQPGTYVDRGFLSTSADPGIATEVFGGDGANAVLTLRVPAGSRAVYAGGSEREVLLPRGTSFRVDRVSVVGGRLWAEAVVL